MQFGMPTLIEHAGLAENVRLCRCLGLNFIELNMNFPEYQLPALEDTEALLKAGEEAGLYFTIHLDENLNVADFNPLVRQAYGETVRRSIQAAKKLLALWERFGDGTRPLVLNMHMHHGIYVKLPDRKVEMYERDFDSYMQSFAAFRSLCETWIGGAPLMICIENTDGFRTYEKAAIRYLLESPCFGLTWDIGHSKASGEGDVPFIREHEDRLIHFHVHDGSEGPPRNHLALGDGKIPLADRLALAKKCKARCVLETKTVRALEKSVHWLKENGWKPERCP